jgi:hypothetical protein
VEAAMDCHARWQMDRLMIHERALSELLIFVLFIV